MFFHEVHLMVMQVLGETRPERLTSLVLEAGENEKVVIPEVEFSGWVYDRS